MDSVGNKKRERERPYEVERESGGQIGKELEGGKWGGFDEDTLLYACMNSKCKKIKFLFWDKTCSLPFCLVWFNEFCLLVFKTFSIGVVLKGIMLKVTGNKSLYMFYA